MPFFAIPAVFLLGFFGASLDWNYAFNPSEPRVGAFGDPFISIQLAASPSNGNCLTTDGTNNAWGSCGSGGSGVFPFSADTNFAQVVYSTSTPTLWFKSGMFASSTSYFVYASSTAVSGTSLCISTDCRTSWPTAGGSSFGQAWELFGSGAWLAPTTTKGIIVAASSTIGSGTQTGGLTISGGATTSGSLLVQSSATIASNLNVQGGTTDLGSDGVQLDHNAGVLTITGKSGAGGDIIFDFANTAGSIEMNSSAAETMDWTNITLSKFTNASSTLFSTNYASSSAWYGGGLLSDCDTAATSKLLWDTTTGRFSCGTDTDTGITAYNAWTNPQAGTSATTSGMIFSAASSTFVGGFSALNSTSTNATSTSLAITTALRLFGTTYTTLAALGNALVNAVTAVTPTGTWDFGGATSVEMVNGSNPTTDAVGEYALDTTANEFLIATSTVAAAPGVMKMWQPIRFSYASSTQGMGTTTRSLGVAPAAGYLDEIQCDFSNFMRVMIYDGTNRLNDLVASSTIGTVKFTTNNTFTSGEAMRIDIGTTTNINSSVFGGCTAKFYYTRN